MTEEELVPFTAEIKTPDFEKSLAFYTKILGFEILRISGENKFATLVYNKGQFLIQGQEDVAEPRGGGVFFRFFVDGDIHEYHDLVKSRGATISKPIEKMFYGLTRFYVTDPFGYQIKFVSR